MSEKKKKSRKWQIATGIAALLLILLFIGSRMIRARNQIQLAETQTGETVTVFIGDLAASATASGQIKAAQTARLSVNSPGLVETVLIRAGDEVTEGDLLIQLNTDNLQLQLERAQHNVALRQVTVTALQNGSRPEDIQAAQAAVTSAQINLDNLLAGPTTQDIAEAEANLRAQQANINSALISYDGTAAPNETAVASAKVDLLNAQLAYNNSQQINENNPNIQTHEALLAAQERLSIAQAAWDKVSSGPNNGTVSSAAANISSAVANRNKAEASLDSLMAGPTAEQIAAAKASLAQAQANLDRLVTPSSAADLAVAEAELEKALLSLEAAEETLAKAAIRAPFTGRITTVSIAPGEFASGVVAEMVSTAFHVTLNVDEIDVGILQVGQNASVTLETWPNEIIPAVIVFIAPSAQSGNGTVAYDVQLNLDPVERPVRVGMTANANIITSEHPEVLIVSNAAITADRKAGTYTVNRVTRSADGEMSIEEVEVVIGLKDNKFSQIISGLEEGDELIIGELVIPTLEFGPGRPNNN